MDANGHHHEPLPPPTEEATRAHLEAVTRALGDTPETVITLHFLREGDCDVLVVGDPADLEGLVVQSRAMPTEPVAFGSSAEAIASLLPFLDGWTCLNVPLALADDLIEPVAAAFGATGIRLFDDVYHVLERTASVPPVEGARLLGPGDRDLLVSSAAALAGDAVDRLADTLVDGHVAAVVREGQVVSLAHTFAMSERHADIGVVTHPGWRGQGFATATAGLVAEAVRQGGRTPVWSCGGTNLASLRVAAKLGFVEVSRRVYLVPESVDAGAAGQA